MRVFLDTNVLVSAFASRGLSTDLFELVLIEHQLVTGRNVLRELDKALRRKIKLPARLCAELVALVSAEAVLIVESAPAAECRADDDDRRILGEALAGEASAFVTGDAVLVALRSIGGMSIVTPRQMWELVRSP
ncbi:MAG TPA: putative toxin-antitoxin system toxin component, PIN family [Burkholderiales bacterium]|nr:putative toxin-antitoxin system toxin component, PIN family [Burkholderiales bacterium]